jgi:hypothetical protein
LPSFTTAHVVLSWYCTTQTPRSFPFVSCLVALSLSANFVCVTVCQSERFACHSLAGPCLLVARCHWSTGCQCQVVSRVSCHPVCPTAFPPVIVFVVKGGMSLLSSGPCLLVCVSSPGCIESSRVSTWRFSGRFVQCP